MISMNNIQMIVLDVDGTLTDGNIYIDNAGNEMKAFNVKDGLGIAQAIKSGIECVIITGRTSKIVEIRAKELGIKYIYQGVHAKSEKLREISRCLGISLNNIAYVGDDINDLEVMKSVAFPACPNDAVYEVKSISKYISTFDGGKGAVREIIEIILKSQNQWTSITDRYEGTVQ